MKNLLAAGAIGLATLVVVGCTTTTLTVNRTRPDSPVTLEAKRTAKIPTKLLFLSDKEASCPNQCSAVSNEEYRNSVDLVEHLLMKKGFELITGGVVSRVEDRLKESKTREIWDRMEKALLLGKDTGADAIFQVKALYFDRDVRAFARPKGSRDYIEVPLEFARQASGEKKGLFSSKVPTHEVPVWSLGVELRLVDASGKVIWTGSKVVRMTDILPEAWIKRFPKFGAAKQNYLLDLFWSRRLQRAIMQQMIEELIGKLPTPEA